jgi:arginase
MAQNVAQAVKEAAMHSVVINLGGDHSASVGTLRGALAAHDSLGVIWIDAHPDVHTHETTKTGNIHGMPAALAMGFGHPSLASDKAISPENFLFAGVQDFDQAEIDFLRAHRTPVYTMLDIASKGLFPLLQAIDALAKRVDHVWISMDMDSIHYREAPGVAMPNTNGLTRREVLSLARYIGKTCPVAGIDIVEILPLNDHGGKTAMLALELIANFLGSEHSWYQEYMARYEDARSV